MKYAIYVCETTAELRDAQICQILDLDYKPTLNKNSNFLGFNNDIKFLNWYDNPEYIKTWNTFEEAESFLNFILEQATKYYKTWKDPFRAVLKTKGDWKNYTLIITEYDKSIHSNINDTEAHSV